MIIQGFQFQDVLGNAKSQSNNTTNTSKNTNKAFDTVLGAQNRNNQSNESNKKEKVDNKSLVNQGINSNTRKVEDKSKENSQEESLESSESTSSNKDQTIEELIQSLNNIILLLQNIKDLGEISLQDIDLEEIDQQLELSINDLINLKDMLQGMSTESNLIEENIQLQEALKNIETIISSVQNEGSVEVNFEDLLKDLKSISDVLGVKLNKNSELMSNENLPKQIDELAITVDKCVEKLSKQQEGSDIKDLDSKSKDTKVKIKIIAEDIDHTEESTTEEVEELGLKLSTVTEDSESAEQRVIKNESQAIASTVQINQQISNNANMNVEKVTTETLQGFNIDNVDVLKQITNKVKADYNESINEIKIKLSPEHLGNLTIKVTLERGIVTARALVENSYVKNMIESNLNTLKENLKEQGIDFETIDVSVGQDSEDQSEHQQGFARNRRARSSKQVITNTNTDEYEEVEIQTPEGQVGEGSLDITI